MGNKANTLSASIARPSQVDRFRAAMIGWSAFWLLILLFVFSGIRFSIGPFEIRTLALDWSFIREWWQFISRGVIVTFGLSIVSMVCAVVLALAAALARLSRVAPLNSFASLYVSLMRGTPMILQLAFIYYGLA